MIQREIGSCFESIPHPSSPILLLSSIKPIYAKTRLDNEAFRDRA